jgi:hypothetical protein
VHDEPYLQLAMGTLGRVHVSGLLVEGSAQVQRLEFEFHTDQTVLSFLVRDLLEVAGDVAA